VVTACWRRAAITRQYPTILGKCIYCTTYVQEDAISLTAVGI
jgi:hypothetical protein